MRKSVRRVAIVAATVAATAAGAAPIASASTSFYPWECPDDAYACLWDGANGTGDRYVLRTGGVSDLPHGYRDKISSVRCIDAPRIALLNWNERRQRFDYLDGDYAAYNCQHDLNWIANNTADRVDVVRY